MKTIYLCAICNTSSGSCLEDCQFCTQSVYHKADIERYKYKNIDTILEEVSHATANGATGFCLVTSGKGLDDKKVAFISKAASAICEQFSDINLIACNGTASIGQLLELKKAGVKSYNHNLESSAAFYPNICTTHSWDERFETCLAIKEVGLNLVCGGIFGLGESHKDRESFVSSLKELQPRTVPLNFYHPNPALPLKAQPLEIEEALDLVSWVRSELPDVRLMVAGGREITFKERQADIFERGADAIVIGNYLTTAGADPDADRKMIRALGYKIATSCNG